MVGTWSPDQVRLVTLDGSGATVLVRDDVRGFDVKDVVDQKVGVVDDLVIDEAADRVRLLKVGYGGILGFGREHRLVPVDIVESVAGRSVFLGARKAVVESAPVGEDIAGEFFMTELYEHYGHEPYWSNGYREPDWNRPE